jgi:probable DNA metabolism protein
MQARLASPTDIVGFRSEAQSLLANQIPPEDVEWSAPTDAIRGAPANDPDHSRTPARAASSIVPSSFVRLCEYVVQHRDPERFALLSRLLWRLVHEPDLRHEPHDHDMTRAHHMAHAVRRDIHKLKTHLNFHVVPDPERPDAPLHLAWCEPAHHIVDSVAPWLAQRNAAQRWALLTPERSVYWDGRQLHYEGGAGGMLSTTASDAEWLARWRSVFAPVSGISPVSVTSNP